MSYTDGMIKENRRYSLREIGLTQDEAAELLATTSISVGRQERGDTKGGPLRGALEFLLAVWPELDEEQRRIVRQRLAELRCSNLQ